MKVLFLPEVVNQFLELAQVLYDEGYLGFKDAAIAYSEQLFRDIQTNLPLKVVLRKSHQSCVGGIKVRKFGMVVYLESTCIAGAFFSK